MRAVVFAGDRKIEFMEFPDPTPGPGEVVLAIKASGMCGSDLHNYRAPANPGEVVTGVHSSETGKRRFEPPGFASDKIRADEVSSKYKLAAIYSRGLLHRRVSNWHEV